MTAPQWARYRRCPTCHALLGEPCRILSGSVVDGRPDAVLTVAERPHSRRMLLSRHETGTR